MGSSFSVYGFLLVTITLYVFDCYPSRVLGMTFFFLSTFSNLYLELYIPFLFGLFYPFTILFLFLLILYELFYPFTAPFLFLLILYGIFYPFSTLSFLSLCVFDFSTPYLYGLVYNFHFFLLNNFPSSYSVYSLV